MSSEASLWGLGLSSAGFILLLAVAYRLGRNLKTSEDFLLGGRRFPSWAGAVSLAVSEISVMTVLGLPAVAYQEDWSYLAFFAGSAGGRLAAAVWIVPPLYRSGSVTVYEFLGSRFGSKLRTLSACLFLLSRLSAAAARLMALAVAVSVLTGLHPGALIAVLCAVGALYSGLGGLGAVVWGSLIQAAFLLAAGLGTLAFLSGQIQGGAGEFLHLARESGRLGLWPASGGFLAVLGGMTGAFTAFAGDQETVQRLLAMRSDRSAQRAIVFGVGASLLLFALYLAVGTGLYVFYEQHPEMALPSDPGNVYPHFAVQMMPVPLRGLLVAAAVMATVDAPLISLGGALVTDILLPRGLPARRSVKAARWAAAGGAAALACAAWILYGRQDWMGWALRLGAGVLGPVAVAVAVAAASKWRCRRACLAGASGGAVLNVVLLALKQSGALTTDWGLLTAATAAATALFVRAAAGRLDGPR